MSATHRGRTVMASIAIVVAAVAGGVAYAADDPASEEIFACVSDQGMVRIVAEDTGCRKNESLISWNRQGPTGPAGQPGTPGERGPAGPPGVTSPASRWYADRDADGHGDWYDRIDSTVQPPGFVSNNTDCNDDRADVNPASGNSLSRGWDYDCDGLAAEQAITWYADNDGDGYGNEANSVRGVTSRPPGAVTNPHDCDDSNAGVTGECRGTDFYYYVDSDGNPVYGEAGAMRKPVGDEDGDSHYVVGAGQGAGEDCNDLDPSVFPGNFEIRYDGLDNDCHWETLDVEPYVADVGRHDPDNWGWRTP